MQQPDVCERCGKPASVNVTAVEGGRPVARRLCDACAEIPDSARQMAFWSRDSRRFSHDDAIRRGSERSQALAGFLRSQGRLPTDAELEVLDFVRHDREAWESVPLDDLAAFHEWMAEFMTGRNTFPRPERILAWAKARYERHG